MQRKRAKLAFRVYGATRRTPDSFFAGIVSDVEKAVRPFRHAFQAAAAAPPPAAPPPALMPRLPELHLAYGTGNWPSGGRGHAPTPTVSVYTVCNPFHT